MYGFSVVDGFVEITESSADMIKSLANEPSAGLFYVQQHAQNVIPNLVNLKNSVSSKCRDVTLHTEDLEDSIVMARSMKECGFPIAEDMIKDIKKSLTVISTQEPEKGLLSNRGSSFQLGASGSYFSTVFQSAKQKASKFKWAQLDSSELIVAKGGNFFTYRGAPLDTSSAKESATLVEREGDELPVSSPIDDEVEEGKGQLDENSLVDYVASLSESFDEFRADKEAKLEEWLGEIDIQGEFYRRTKQ